VTLPKGFPEPKKKLRCRLGLHSPKYEVKDRLNICKICGNQYYAKSLRARLKGLESGGGDGGADGGGGE